MARKRWIIHLRCIFFFAAPHHLSVRVVTHASWLIDQLQAQNHTSATHMHGSELHVERSANYSLRQLQLWLLIRPSSWELKPVITVEGIKCFLAAFSSVNLGARAQTLSKCKKMATGRKTGQSRAWGDNKELLWQSLYSVRKKEVCGIL